MHMSIIFGAVLGKRQGKRQRERRSSAWAVDVTEDRVRSDRYALLFI